MMGRSVSSKQNSNTESSHAVCDLRKVLFPEESLTPE